MSLTDLGVDMFIAILNNLSYLELIRIARVSKMWCRIAYKLLGKEPFVPIFQNLQPGEELIIIHDGTCHNGFATDINNVNPSLYTRVDPFHEVFRKFNMKVPLKQSIDIRYPLHIHKNREGIHVQCTVLPPASDITRNPTVDGVLLDGPNRIDIAYSNKYALMRMLYDIRECAKMQQEWEKQKVGLVSDLVAAQ